MVCFTGQDKIHVLDDVPYDGFGHIGMLTSEIMPKDGDASAREVLVLGRS